ncbi:hypothetical protein BJ973_006682 [Actinoplanes tereljensis]|uniref:HTH iclR-type domain-containing protein n=1 Tax=Paractinoplanes tereljensis TaxID=571912 RepID=A0A919TQX7_9ACTN|nr:hypothetical protein [Actinoplanes tereljensis]GIF19638.1 hypothetical protein Ate02nite_23680 [Actinoplanes tereljensis]
MTIELNPPTSSVELVRRASEALAARLPAGWSLRPATIDAAVDRGVDAAFDLAAPDGRSAVLIIEAKNVAEVRDVPGVVRQIAAYVGQVDNGYGVLVARYLSPQVRSALTESGVSFVDATGNIRVELSAPGLYLGDRGADADPWRGRGRPRGTLKGAPAARIVRAIADIPGEWTIRELVRGAGVSTGTGYRVIDFLEREDLATREERGRIAVPSWEKVLRRWSEDYSFVGDSRVTRWIAPRGLEALLKRIAQTGPVDYAITGTVAAAEWAEYAPARAAAIYTADAESAAADWGLRAADAGANVLLAEPEIDVPFVRTVTNTAGLRLAAPSQVVVDLMTGPGRNPQEAEELMEWMKNNEDSWRAG